VIILTVADSCSRRQHSESCGSCMPLTGFTTPACTLRCSQRPTGSGLVNRCTGLQSAGLCTIGEYYSTDSVPQPSCPIRGLCAVDREPSRLGLGVWPFGRAVRCAAHVPWCAPLKSSANPIATLGIAKLRATNQTAACLVTTVPPVHNVRSSALCDAFV
jgi:hypothetical protein